MEVRRAEVVPAGCCNQRADRTSDEDRIARGLDAAELKAAGQVGDEAPAQVLGRLAGVLIFIEALRRGVPDVHLGAGNGFTGSIQDLNATDERRTGRFGAHETVAAVT